MRRSIFILALCSLFFVPTFAQEAFYIYRNDGDFNGFFYDEVQEMRYSKIDLDSVEHDNYIMYEVQLADTLYRIPLASIDSIGFQQPEIKLNPKVKFIEYDGYSPYFYQMTNSCIYFKDLPTNLIPQVGDVLLGLPTDSIAETKYIETIGDLGSGSFSCVVTQVENAAGGFLNVYGHPVENIGDVFEQYITVEKIGVDKQGQVHRRIAGCTPEGFPVKIKKAEGDTKDITLIDFSGTVSKSWDIYGSSRVGMSADVNFILRLRAAYNITWTQFYVKISKDLIMKVKPTLSLSVSDDWEGTNNDLIELPHILFPAACPVFQTNPFPEVFVRVGGSLEAKLNLPKVHLGFGDDIIIDSRNLFPISYEIRVVPDENAENPTDEMLDLSGELLFSGYVQTGIAFEAEIETASWFKKILQCGIGLHLHVGPKVSGNVAISKDLTEMSSMQGMFYDALCNSQISMALLSFDLDAGAKAWAMWGDPQEETFFNKSWEFLCDTMKLAPKIEDFEVEVNEHEVKFTVTPDNCHVFGTQTISVGLNPKANVFEKELGDWIVMKNVADDYYSCTLPLSAFSKVPNSAVPVVNCGALGRFIQWGKEVKFKLPYQIEWIKDEMHFGPHGGKDSLIFITNSSRDSIKWSSAYNEGISLQKVALGYDEETRRCTLVLKQDENEFFFSDVSLPKNDEKSPFIHFGMDTIKYHFGVTQDAKDLSAVRVYANGCFTNPGDNIKCAYYSASTAIGVRNGENGVDITGSYVEGHATYTINLHLQQTGERNGRIEQFTCSGTIKQTEDYPTTHMFNETVVTFESLQATYDYSYSEYQINGIPTSATNTYSNSMLDEPRITTMQQGADAYIDIRISKRFPDTGSSAAPKKQE